MIALVLVLISGAIAFADGENGAGYVSYFSGSATDVTPNMTGGMLLAGGGADRDDAMKWLLQQGGMGDVVVLRTSGSDGYNSYLVGLGAHSVESIVITSSAGANSDYVIDRIGHAEVIFIAGGDQATYLHLWKGTRLQTAVNARVAAGASIGGTSAGLAVLGRFIYSALDGTIDSAEALADPYHGRITLDRDFVSLAPMKNIITDTHFASRDRMGRLITFLARLQQDGWDAAPRGLGIDEATALGVKRDGTAQIFSDGGSAYFLTTTGHETRTCVAGTALTLRPIAVHKMTAGSTFDLNTWRGAGGVDYTLAVTAGAVTSTSTTGGIY